MIASYPSMWRYYLLGGRSEVLFYTDDRKQALDKMDSLVWARGVGASPVILVRTVFRKQLAVEKRDDV